MSGPVGITLGDPAGIGAEITLKALVAIKSRNIIVIGPGPVLERERERLGMKTDLPSILDTGPVGKFEPGKVQKRCGEAALEALKVGVDLLKAGRIGALVTAPVSKEAMRLAGFKYPGQTEFLARRLGVRRYAMLAWSPNFKVVFVTIHLPLARVPAQISAPAVLEKILLLDEFLRLEDNRSPRIGVLALNPHAEEFSLGEEGCIKQAIKLARERAVNAEGPLPSDSIFARRNDFDGFVAMYHDQAMIPAKLLARGRGVNVTIGLGKIRTSPLHGVAFDIAGKGVADPGSMISAIRLARRLADRTAELKAGVISLPRG
ncbi:MAG: PdxA family dehydrogenase [bacterium]